MQIDELLKPMVDGGISNLHLKVPSPPVLRVDRRLIAQEDLPALTTTDVEFVFEQVTT